MKPHLSRAAETFLSAKASIGRASGTTADYRNHLNRFVEVIGDRPIDEITNDQILDFFGYLQNFKFDPSHCGKDPTRRLSPKTILNAHTTLSVFFGWIAEEYEMPNPMRVPRLRANPNPIVPLTEDEVEAILKACDYSYQAPTNRAAFKMRRPTRYRDRAIVMTLYDTGLRVGELCALRFQDLDTSNNRIRVLGKGKKARDVYIGQAATHALHRYHLERFPTHQPDPEDYVIADSNGIRPMTRSGVRQLLIRLGKKAGIKGVHPHRFRHTFAVSYLRHGGDIYSLQDILGHSTLEMVRRYLHLANTDVQTIHRRASPGDHLARR
jgi:integrase/recombinase XerD